MTTTFDKLIDAQLSAIEAGMKEQRAKDAQIARECADRWADEVKQAPHVEFMASAARIIAEKIERGE